MLSVPLALSTDASAAVQLGPLAILGVLYERRARALAQAGDPVPAGRRACFYGGFVVIAVALIWLGASSRELLWVQTIEQLLLGDVAALLIVLGLTAPLLAPVIRIALFERLRVLSHPAIALLAWAIDVYAWHLPVLYQAALRYSGIGVLEHAMLFGLGLNMWMCLLGPLPKPGWFGDMGRLIYIVAARVAGAVLGNIFLWSNTIFYPDVLTGQARFHLSPLADQSIAGAIMLVEDTLITLGLFWWLFMRSTREREERRQLLEFASARGLELSTARAARAVASGRGAELRRRLEARLEEGERASERIRAPSGANQSM